MLKFLIGLCFTIIIGTWTNGYAQGSDAYWDESFFGSTSTNGQVYAILAHQDSIVFVGGGFQSTAVEQGTANNIARYASGNWSRLDIGVNNTVRALAIHNNDLYVAGLFDSAGGINTLGIAKYDLSTSSWAAVGNGLNGQALSLALKDSNVYVGGGFDTAGSINANSIAKWNGHSWSALGNGVNGLVYAVLIVDTDLYVGGDFDSAGTVAAKNIAKWNGSSWSALGSGVNKVVRALTYDDSSIIVGGDFDSAGGSSARYIASWNGSWSSLGSGASNGTNNGVTALAYSNSILYVGGDFDSVGTTPASHIAQRSGSSWSTLGSGVDVSPLSIGTKGDSIYVGGLFHLAGNKRAAYLCKWQYINLPRAPKEAEPEKQDMAANQFNDTYIPIKIPDGAQVRLTLLNEKREIVSTILEKKYTIGNHFFQWSPEDLPPGKYILQAEFDGKKQSWTFSIYP